MQMKCVKAFADGRELLQNVEIADNFLTRLRGLAYRREIGKGYGMLIRPCSQIHTFGMRFAIDAVFLNNDGQVVCVKAAIPPRRFLPYIPHSGQVLELAAGAAAGIALGCRIEFES